MKLHLQAYSAGVKKNNKSSQTSTPKSVTPHSVLVVFAKPLKDSVKIEHSVFQKSLAHLHADKIFTGKASETLFFRDSSLAQSEGFQHLLLVGLGDKLDGEGTRSLAAGVLGALKSVKGHTATLLIDGLAAGKKDFAHHVQALTEGLLLSNYNFDELKTGKKEAELLQDLILATSQSSVAAVRNAFEHATILAECQNFARRLGDMPGNLMTPTILAQEAVAATKGTTIKSEVWDKARIKKEKMGGLLGVAEGSDEEPRFIILRYNGAPKGKKPLVFVGKGLTFDTGGISLKPGAAMEEMKYDMCGGANVIAAVIAMAKLKLKVNVIGLVASTENMPSGRATKPGDVHTARNGKTFEVNNTDAEGRLILADALSYATEQEPAMIVDAATLTGAIVMALGNIHTGYFTKYDSMVKLTEKAAGVSGELVWRMPLVDFHLKDMKGTFADLSNISSSKGAGSATAAAFLEQFVGEGIPWAHFDIAGTAWAVGGRFPYHPKKGASGAMVRTFVEMAKASV
jgi:leucyl aminopeptidase